MDKIENTNKIDTNFKKFIEKQKILKRTRNRIIFASLFISAILTIFFL